MKKLENIIQLESYIQPKGTYYDTNGIPFKQEEDIEVETSYSRIPNNEELMEKINEIIDYLNERDE